MFTISLFLNKSTETSPRRSAKKPFLLIFAFLGSLYLPVAMGVSIMESVEIGIDAPIVPGTTPTLDILAGTLENGIANEIASDPVVPGRIIELNPTLREVIGRVQISKPNTSLTVSSQTGGSTATATYQPRTGNTATLSGTATTRNGRSGYLVADPFFFEPFTITYSPLINEIIIDIDAPNEFGGVAFFANDSRFSDPLWELRISADDILTSVTDLLIEFASQPILNLNDTTVIDNVRTAFTFVDGVATLLNHTLFTTQYSSDQQIEFSETIIGIASVPEPAAIILVTIGLFGMRLKGLRPNANRASVSTL